MRPTVWLTLLFFVVIAAGLRAHATSGRATNRAPARAAAPETWVVEGKWMPTPEEAVTSALEKAQAELAAYLRGRDARLAWLPDVKYIREHLQKDVGPEDAAREDAASLRRIPRGGREVLEEEKEFPGPVGKMRRARVKVVLSADDYSAIKRKDAEHRKEQRLLTAHHRQVLLAKVLAGVVALLGTAVGYLRLEEATKGYYTTWLRVAALGLLTAVVAGLLFVA